MYTQASSSRIKIFEEISILDTTSENLPTPFFYFLFLFYEGEDLPQPSLKQNSIVKVYAQIQNLTLTSSPFIHFLLLFRFVQCCQSCFFTWGQFGSKKGPNNIFWGQMLYFVYKTLKTHVILFKKIVQCSIIYYCLLSYL